MELFHFVQVQLNAAFDITCFVFVDNVSFCKFIQHAHDTREHRQCFFLRSERFKLTKRITRSLVIIFIAQTLCVVRTYAGNC